MKKPKQSYDYLEKAVEEIKQSIEEPKSNVDFNGNPLTPESFCFFAVTVA